MKNEMIVPEKNHITNNFVNESSCIAFTEIAT